MEILKELGIDPQLILVNIIGFLCLYALLKKFLYGPITHMMAERTEDIRSTYETAEAEKTHAEQFRRDYEKRLAEVETEAHERIQAAIKEAHGLRDDIVNEARTKAEKALDRGIAELAREREKTVVELRQEVADLVVKATSSILEKSVDDQTHRKLIDEFIGGVGKKN